MNTDLTLRQAETNLMVVECHKMIDILRATVSRLEGENEELRLETGTWKNQSETYWNELNKLRSRLTVLERVRVASEALPMYEPNHDHRVTGHWDSDGAPCRICSARKEFLESLDAARGKEDGE